MRALRGRHAAARRGAGRGPDEAAARGLAAGRGRQGDPPRPQVPGLLAHDELRQCARARRQRRGPPPGPRGRLQLLPHPLLDARDRRPVRQRLHLRRQGGRPARITVHRCRPPEGDLRLLARHRLRVVRLLPLRHARRVLLGALLPAGQRHARRSSRASRPSAPASPCARSARSCSGASATWSAASTRSSSRSSSWACRRRWSACCRPMRRSASGRRSCW